jgi:hypothetical protein
VSRDEQITRYHVTRAHEQHGDQLRGPARRSAGQRVSFDEANPRRCHELAAIICDLDRRRVVDVLDSRGRPAIGRHPRCLSETER